MLQSITVPQLCTAIQGYDISQDRIDRQFAIGKEFYDQPLKEKTKFTNPNLDKGEYNGYRPAGRRVYVLFSTALRSLCHSCADPIASRLDAESDIRDRTETYNIPSQSHSMHEKTVAQRTDSIYLHRMLEFGNGYFDHSNHPEPIQTNLEEIQHFARVW